MANTIALAENFLPILDEIYKVGSKTSVLDAANGDIKFLHANKIELFELEMDGLGNYSRATGFPTGDVTGSWRPYTLQVDRGRTFTVDSMDDEETINQAFGKLVGEFMRRHVIPEVDTYRISKYAGLADSSQVVAIGAKTMAEAIDDAELALTNGEVPEEGKIMFVSADGYKALKSGIVRQLGNDNVVSHAIGTYDGMPVIVVPQNRMNTTMSLTTNGYTTSGTDILAMIVHPTAVAQVVKHEMPRIFDPKTNQAADAWKFDYRLYHDTFVKEQKKNGIYVITK